VATEAELIIRTLDRHLAGPADIRLFGGAALVLAYGLTRTTEDADLLMDDDECSLLVDTADFGNAVERTNEELEPRGLYLTHIWGPEQQVLSPGWRARCRHAPLDGLKHIRLSVLGPTDIIVSKLARADELDLQDISWLLRRENLAPARVWAEVDLAVVPAILAEAFAQARIRLARVLPRP